MNVWEMCYFTRSSYIAHYYSFKILLRLWLAKITGIIHYDQQLSTKFGRILPYQTDDVKTAAKLQVIEPLTEKTWDEFELFPKWVIEEHFTRLNVFELGIILRVSSTSICIILIPYSASFINC